MNATAIQMMRQRGHGRQEKYPKCPQIFFSASWRAPRIPAEKRDRGSPRYVSTKEYGQCMPDYGCRDCYWIGVDPADPDLHLLESLPLQSM